MRRTLQAYATLVLGLLAASLPMVPRAWACTTFASGSGKALIIAKNYDWSMEQGVVVANKRGVKKRGFVLRGSPARWTSRYGSITFNQYGREFPNGGINEHGLVVEIMWLDESEYPPGDARPAVNELQWIQYQLDNYDSVAQMIAHARDLVVSPIHGKVHYLACDRSGACAAFEYIAGELLTYSGKSLPHRALTNTPYTESRAHYQRSERARMRRSDRSSRARFVVAALASKRRMGVDAAFSALRSVEQPGMTKWQIVYEPTKGTIHFKTASNQQRRTIALEDFDFDCSSPALVVDMATAANNTRAVFEPATFQGNYALVRESLANVPGLPWGADRLIAAFPDTTSCSLDAL